MNTQKNYSILSALTLALLAFTHLHAQTLTETLQKEVWNTQTPMTADAWATYLPAADRDTLFQADAKTAEAFVLDESGRPTEIVLLFREDGTWEPQTRTAAHWNNRGHLTSLQSWTHKQGIWTNESMTSAHFDANGNALRLDFEIWEEDGWTTSYVHQYSQPAPMLGLK